MNLKGAIFDLDGTLLDSMYIWDTLGDDFLLSKGYDPEPNLYETLKAMSLMQAAQYMSGRYPLLGTAGDVLEQINAMIENDYLTGFQLKAGVLPFLEKLKSRNIKMCVATATERPLAQAALERLNVFGYFCGLITCTEAGTGKDSPEIFHKALQILGTGIHETVVFEDALHAVKTAKSAGFLVAAVYDKSADVDKTEIQALADWYLNSFDDWED